MTVVGGGGATINGWRMSRQFQREYRKLTADMQARVDRKLEDLLRDPRPSGLRFEKLQGHSSPAIYTIHVTGDIKLSMELDGTVVFLRRVNTHKRIDRAP